MQVKLLVDTKTEHNGIPITFPQNAMIRDIDAIVPGAGSEVIENVFYSFDDPSQITRESISKAIYDAILNASEADYRDENEEEYNDEQTDEVSVSIIGTDDFGQFVILKQIPAEDILFIPENGNDEKMLPALKEIIPQVKWCEPKGK